MQIFYTIIYPETAISILTTGKNPEKFPSYIKEKNIILFSNALDCLNSVADKMDKFVLRLFLNETEWVSDSSNKINTQEIPVASIKDILVPREKNKNFLNKVFKGKFPFSIFVIDNLFDNHFSSGKELENFVNGLAHRDSKEESALVKNSIISSKDFSKITNVKEGDIFESKMQALVNPVNCVGVMGAGLALIFKEKYPKMFKEYKTLCSQKKIKIGKPYLHKINDNKYVVSFPTKDHWKNSSKIEYIKEGLKCLVENIKTWGITSIAIPPLGCGKGGLKWTDVRPLIEEYAKSTGIPVEIYEPALEPKSTYRYKPY